MNVIKRLFIILIILAAVAGAALFFYRYQIIQYSADNIIRSLLPEYVKIDKIEFDAQNGRLVLKDFKILNPPNFSERYLVTIEEISCKYRMMGKNLLEGFEVLDPSFERLVLNIERLKDGRINIEEMKKAAEKASSAAKGTSARNEPKAANAVTSKIIGNRKPADMIKIPTMFPLKDGKVIFVDRIPSAKPHMITFENINAQLSMRLDENYSKLEDLNSTGEGNLNGDRNEVVKWTISLNPTTPKLTMSNRFEVSGLDIVTFEPYYDKYSPFIFKKGKFSGTLVFDFDNGSIGSTNEVHLTDFLFYIKRGYENAEFWGTTVPDLAKYFTTSFGEIIFDFKIKGEIGDPKFYLGPISKQALTSMAVDKISSVIQQVAGPQSGTTAPGAPKSDIEKAKEYIELFKGLIKKD